MDRVMTELLRRLEGHPSGEFVVLGVAVGGHELRAARRERPGTALRPGDAIPPYVTVCVEVPEVPRGRVEFVLCRWSDSPDTMAYHSLTDNAPRPEWTRIKLTPAGVRLSVRWSRREEPRVYDYEWTTEPPRPSGS